MKAEQEQRIRNAAGFSFAKVGNKCPNSRQCSILWVHSTFRGLTVFDEHARKNVASCCPLQTPFVAPRIAILYKRVRRCSTCNTLSRSGAYSLQIGVRLGRQPIGSRLIYSCDSLNAAWHFQCLTKKHDGCRTKHFSPRSRGSYP